MFRKVLVANRGEIACRIINTLHDLNIVAIAVYSDADAEARHVTLADEAYRIGPAPITQSYLAMENIVDVARTARAEAIHPGYGLLSDRPEFPTACEAAGLTFLGPSSAAIRSMGTKLGARQLMGCVGVPVVPGVMIPSDAGQPEALAAELGFPVLVKASGGGGIGMRVVREPSDLAGALESCRRLAERFYGDDTVYIEKYIDEARHVEIQVLGDRHGNVVAVHGRECSIQRRHQKVIEEAPSPAVDKALRARMEYSAVRGARRIEYTSAGTLEFVLDLTGKYFFIEMNTRLQVEHAVTEVVTGLDLVAEQIRVAASLELSFESAPPMCGYAIEYRIYAEAPKSFLPSLCGGRSWRASASIAASTKDT